MNSCKRRQKTVLVTGGSHGIGRAAVERFHRDNWRVYFTGSNPADPRGPALAAEHPGARFLLADASDESAMEAVFAEITAQAGGVDAVVNNAGVGVAPSPPHLADLDRARRVVEVNLLGTLVCMKWAIRAMLAGGQPGVIVNTSSIAALRAATGADPSYSAAKAGILALTREAAACGEYRDRIRFYAVVPGYVETRMTADDDKAAWARRLPSGQAGRPEQVAELVWELIHSRALISGQIVYMDGGAFLL